MKTTILLFAILAIGSCTKEESDSCYDKAMEEAHSGICTMEYDPVCGCDNNTYSNECVANSHGIVAVYKGDCK